MESHASNRPSRPPRRHPGRAKGRPPSSRHKAGPKSGARRSPDRKGGRDYPRKPRPVGGEISPSRLAAARALYGLEKGAKTADVLEKPGHLGPEDTALFRELVYGCTRQKRLLDHHLDSLCQTPFVKLPVEVKISLRLGLYQLLFLDRIPAHAAVHESVNLAKKGGQEALSGFVNAVLRNAETRKGSLEIKGDGEMDGLALRYSHPTWLVKRWAQSLPAEKLESVLRADNEPHPVYLHAAPGRVEEAAADLARQKARVEKVAWPETALRLKGHEGGLFSGESFRKGDWIVQDWVPQAMMRLLPLEPGQRVWDVCAAPGGKTVSLAWSVGEKGRVMATDASPERLKRLAENLKRVALGNVTVYEGDIRKLPPPQKFSLAWVDAPCSGTGVLSRRADLRWRLAPRDIASNVPRQRELLEEAQGHLYPKGYLVYSTCSLEPEENQQVVQAFLKDHPEWKGATPPAPENRPEIFGDGGGITFLPTAEHDGGFLSVLQRA